MDGRFALRRAVSASGLASRRVDGGKKCRKSVMGGARPSSHDGSMEKTTTASSSKLPSARSIDALARMRPQFLSFIRRRGYSHAESEDIVQAAFVRAVEKAASLHDESKLTAWFYRIVRNTMVDHHRRRSCSWRALGEWVFTIAASVDPFDESSRADGEFVTELIGDLKPEYGQALSFFYLENRPLDELARLNGITKKNAAVRLHRARRALHRIVQHSESCEPACRPRSARNLGFDGRDVGYAAGCVA